MGDRRAFLRGAVAMAVAPFVPVPESDGPIYIRTEEEFLYYFGQPGPGIVSLMEQWHKEVWRSTSIPLSYLRVGDDHSHLPIPDP
jgi:hypothetical protein